MIRPRHPFSAIALAAAAIIALPSFAQSTLFDWKPLLWIGLGTSPLATLDYEPLFPWFGATLLGIALARIGVVDLLSPWKVDDRLSLLLRWAGRRSLVIYLVHQPLLIGLLLAAAAILQKS